MIPNKNTKNNGRGKSGGKRLKRSKYWAGIVYEDSCAADWVKRLKALHVKAFVSPKHDRDLTEDGELKKPHWHVVLMYDSLKSEEQAVEDFVEIGAPYYLIEGVRSLKGFARYLCHLDDDEKALYEVADVIEIAGASYYTVALMDNDGKSKIEVMDEIFQYIIDNREDSYFRLVEYALKNRPEWKRVLYGSGSNAVIAFMKSMRYTIDAENSGVR